MRIFARLSKVTGSFIIAIVMSWKSSFEAEETGYSVTDHIPSAVYLVFGISAGKAFWVIAQVSVKRIIVDKGLLKGPASCLDDFDRPVLPSSDPGLLLFLLHPLFQFRPWCWRDENARLPVITKPIVLFPLLVQPAGRSSPILWSVHWPFILFFGSYDLGVALQT